MKRVYTLFALICLCAVFLTLTNYYKNTKESIEQKTSEEPKYLLILESSGVNLYYDNIHLKTYEGIVPEVLPPTDRDNLKSGIVLNDYDSVLSIIEDFDG